MATLFIPLQLREYCGGKSEVEAAGETVRAALSSVRDEYPELVDKLLDGDSLRPNYAVSVDGELNPLGLLTGVEDGSEIHFVAALSGGTRAAG